MARKVKNLSKLENLVNTHKNFEFLENGKIKCTITGHQFMPSEKNFHDHLHSKSYKKATEAEFDISEYQDVLTPHKDSSKLFFCRLTAAKIPAKKSALEKHTASKKFQRRLQEYRSKIKQDESDEAEWNSEEDNLGQGSQQDQEIAQEEGGAESQDQSQIEEDSPSPELNKHRKIGKKTKAKNGKADRKKNKKFNDMGKTRK